MNALIYMLLVVVVAPSLIFLPYLINLFLKNRERTLPQKYDVYESGVQPSRDLYRTTKVISISYYVLAMFFVVLDVDILFIYPLVAALHFFPLSAIVSILFFVFPLFVILLYMYKNSLFDEL
jgi:NADH:ubiquinone oxidoreductase subunit 3 (subunit A)